MKTFSPSSRNNSRRHTNGKKNAAGFRAVANPGKLQSRNQAQINALYDFMQLTVTAVFLDHKPLDRVVGSFWRENRKYGSRDRKMMSETIFSFFRFWGMIRSFVTPQQAEKLEQGELSALPTDAITRLWLAAVLFAGDEPEEALRFAAERAALRLPGSAKTGERSFRKRVTLLAQELAALWHCPEAASITPEAMLPQWALQELGEITPEAFECYLASLAQRPPMWLRVRPDAKAQVVQELSANGFQLRSSERLPDAVGCVNAKVNLYTLNTYRNGDFEVQDLASQTIVAVAAPRAGERWWDACAGAGGKTLAMAEAMQRKGSVVASDIRSYKLDDLRKRARRAQLPNVLTAPWDGGPVRGRKTEKYDGVLVDAPCSCSGVWRRNPDGRWSSSAEEVLEMSTIQRQVLENAAPAVRPNGVLIYATCSLFVREDRQVVESFLSQHEEFELESFCDPLSGRNVAEGMLLVDGANYDCDAMFVARMRKKATSHD